MCLTSEHTQVSESPHSAARTPLSPHARSRRRGGPQGGLPSARAALRAPAGPRRQCRGRLQAAAREDPSVAPFWSGGGRRRQLCARCLARGLSPFPPLRPAGGTMSVVEHVREMAAAGLHSNVRLLSGLLLTMSGNNP